MKCQTYRISDKKSYCSCLGPVSFLLHLLKGKIFFCKDERLPALLGWIFWKILCNNCLSAIAASVGRLSAKVTRGVDTRCTAWPN